MGNRSFLARYRRLQYFRAKHAVVAVGGGAEAYELCHILFGRDGSIYVQFRFNQSVEGVVTILHRDPNAKGPVTLNYAESGKATSHLVKLAHHASGRVHAGQTGKTTNEVGRYSFPLDSAEGRVFQLNAYHLSGFRPVEKVRPQRCYLPFLFTDGAVPPAVTVTGEWLRKDRIIERAHPPGGQIDAQTTVLQRSTGAHFKVFFLGPPKGSPLRQHVLQVSLGTTEVPRNFRGPGLMVFAGLDHPTAIPPKPQPPGALFVMYPSGGALADQIGTIDLPTA